MKKILILGASGMLGATLSEFLSSSGNTIFRQGNKHACDRHSDLTNPTDARDLIKGVNPDIVINLVAMTNVDHCETHINEAYRINCLTLENVIDSFHGSDPPFLIHISTDQVYDGKGLSKESDLCLTNIYALTKYTAELAAEKIPSTVIRTNFFGKSRIENRPSFSDWVIRALKQGDPITAFTDIIFNPVRMETLCRVIAHVVKKKITGTYNVGSKGPLTKADTIFEIAKALDLDTSGVRRGKSRDLGLTAYRPRGMAMDVSLFESTFNFTLPFLKDEIGRLKEE